MEKYKIIRFYENGNNEFIKKGLTLEQAQEHCQDKKTQGIINGIRFFDGYTKE